MFFFHPIFFFFVYRQTREVVRVFGRYRLPGHYLIYDFWHRRRLCCADTAAAAAREMTISAHNTRGPRGHTRAPRLYNIMYKIELGDWRVTHGVFSKRYNNVMIIIVIILEKRFGPLKTTWKITRKKNTAGISICI